MIGTPASAPHVKIIRQKASKIGQSTLSLPAQLVLLVPALAKAMADKGNPQVPTGSGSDWEIK
jgi:hypothetical protein